jgi:hypothetical protein
MEEAMNPLGLKTGDRVWLAKSYRRRSSPYYPKRGGKYSCQGTITGLKGPTWGNRIFLDVAWDNGKKGIIDALKLEPAQKLTDWPGD